MVEFHSANKEALTINVCIGWVLCKIMLLVHGHEQNEVESLPLYEANWSPSFGVRQLLGPRCQSGTQ
jgi:hypothetical protein